MLDIQSIDPAPSNAGKPTFLVDWMITKFCNLDCSYCDSYSHDNHSAHPKFKQTLDTIDFIFKYVDLYMQYKRSWQKGLVLNVYGGEGMIHPNIVEILNEIRTRHAAYKEWPLTVQITTNGVIGSNVLTRVIDYVDDWTISFHSEALFKQRELALKNAKLLNDSGKQVKVIIMMHAVNWQICLETIEFCKTNNIKHIVKALDAEGPAGIHPNLTAMTYTADQMKFIKNYWVSRSTGTGKELIEQSVEASNGVARTQGRACCGGRSMCINQDFKNRVSVVPLTNFTDWFCTVNWYFLHINQLTGEIYNNKDCKTSMRNLNEPLGNLSDTNSIIQQLSNWLETKTLPVVKCINSTCHCGMCAPKAKDLATLKTVMTNHWTEDRTTN